MNRKIIRRMTPGKFVGKLIVYGFLIFIFLVTFFPFWNILVLSFNDASDTLRGGLMLWPRVFSMESYAAVLKNDEILNSLAVTLARTFLGVPLTLLCVSMLAYVLSKPDLVHRRGINFFFVSSFVTRSIFTIQARCEYLN